jgi:uncharacterized protein involved in exopolysaccharide biosynthesis
MNQLQNLESDYNFTFTVYSEMAKQLEQAKLNVAKETPIFSIISPVVVPTDKSAPNRVLILVVFIGIGLIFSLVFVLIGEFVKILKRQWNTV